MDYRDICDIESKRNINDYMKTTHYPAVISNADITSFDISSDGCIKLTAKIPTGYDCDGDSINYMRKYLDKLYDVSKNDIGLKINRKAFVVPSVRTITEEANNVVVVHWTDNTTTVVKCSEGDKPDLYSAFCAALAKKIYGTTSAVYREIDKHNTATINAEKEKIAAKELEERLAREKINHERKIRRLAKRIRNEQEAKKLLETGDA